MNWFVFFTPRFYRVFTLYPAKTHFVFLGCLLFFHFFLRAAVFYFYHFEDELRYFNKYKCLNEFSELFPEDLTISFDLKTNIILTQRRKREINEDEEVLLPLPKCASDVLAISTTFLTKSSLANQVMKRGISPVIKLTKSAPEPIIVTAFKEIFFEDDMRNRKNSKLPVVTVTPNKSLFMDMFPFSFPVH